MKFYLISDNADTAVGLRLAGIEGVVVHERAEALTALNAALADSEVAVVLMTERLVTLCGETVEALKLGGSDKLIVEIPDRHGSGRAGDSIARYVRESVGIKI